MTLVLVALSGLGLVGVVARGPAVSAEGGHGDGDGVVLVTRVDDPITPVIADHLHEVVARGERDGHEAVVIELDTPGGLDSSMRAIVQDLLGADVPVVVFVAPSGARAASAGALIAWASHVVGMAPGTTIGAATPVDLEGGEVGDKVVNDAAAYARAVAEQRGRNVDVAAEAVTEGRALSDGEAVDEGVADLVADDRADLLSAVDGTRVRLASGTAVTLATADAAVIEEPLSPLRRVLQWLADPNVVFLLMSLGTLGLVYELATPGVGVAGGTGLVLILLSLLGLAVLPINAVGFLFVALAVGFYVAELFTPGMGLAAVFGSLSLGFAGVVLFRDDAPGVSLSPVAVIPTATVVGVATIVAGRLALRARVAPALTGTGELIGHVVEVARASSDGSGQALVDGAWWNLRSDGALARGDRVQVRDVDGLDLLVEPAPSTDKEEPS